MLNYKFITVVLILMISLNIGSYAYSMDIEPKNNSIKIVKTVNQKNIDKTMINLSDFFGSFIFTDLIMILSLLIIVPFSAFGQVGTTFLAFFSFLLTNSSLTYFFKGKSEKENSYLYTLLGSFLGMLTYTSIIFLIVYLSSFFFTSNSMFLNEVLQDILYVVLMPMFATYGAVSFYDWNENIQKERNLVKQNSKL